MRPGAASSTFARLGTKTLELRTPIADGRLPWSWHVQDQTGGINCRRRVRHLIVPVICDDTTCCATIKNVWPAPFARGFVPRSAADQSASTYPASRNALRP